MTRQWITPFTAGAFVLSAVTGILIFFHVDSGLNKVVHEWFSWALVLGGLLHILLNFKALTKYLLAKRGLQIFGAFVVILAASFISFGSTNNAKPPFMQPIQALAQAPLATLAQVAQISPQELTERLSKAGITPTADQNKLSDITGNDLGKQLQILNIVFAKTP